MTLPKLHFSRPAVVVPDAVVDNDTVLARVRDQFRGFDAEWEPVEQGIRYVLDKCGTKVRHIEPDPSVSPGQFAARAVANCLEQNEMTAGDIDLLIYGGISRYNYEPATAAEVSGRIGATPLHAFDVTCACAGLIEAMHTAAGYFAVHDELQTAVICAGEVFREHINYDIQSPEDLATSVAGLTLGNAAAAFVLSREALPAGSARLLNIRHRTLPENWELCYAPTNGHFTSHSKELFALSVHVPPEIRALVADVGWTPQEVDHYAFHQPSEAILESVFTELDAKPSAQVFTHDKYANTASTAWALALDDRLRTGTVSPGDKLVMMSAAAGFTIVSAAAVWDA